MQGAARPKPVRGWLRASAHERHFTRCHLRATYRATVGLRGVQRGPARRHDAQERAGSGAVRLVASALHHFAKAMSCPRPLRDENSRSPAKKPRRSVCRPPSLPANLEGCQARPDSLSVQAAGNLQQVGALRPANLQGNGMLADTYRQPVRALGIGLAPCTTTLVAPRNCQARWLHTKNKDATQHDMRPCAWACLSAYHSTRKFKSA